VRAWPAALFVVACHAPPAIVSPRTNAPAPVVASIAATTATVEPKREDLSDGDLLAEDSRPTLRATVEVDAETLPIATWGPPRKDSWLSFFAGPEGFPRFHVEGVSYAEVRTGDFLGFTGKIDGFASDAWPECGPGRPSRPATWRGISVVDWNDSRVTIMMSRGVLDGAACLATATTTLVGRAAAIVPRFVYALRFDRSIYVVMPAGPLAVATDGRAGHGSFSAIVLPLEAHHEAAAAVRISNFGLERWKAMPQLSSLEPETSADPSTCPLATVEVRARGDRLVVALSVATVWWGQDVAHDFVAAVEARAKHGEHD
jgi:hypothetical protein